MKAAVVATGLAAVGAGLVWAIPATAAATAAPVTLSAADQTALVSAYAAYEGIPASDVSGIRAGSVHGAVESSGLEWATATFTPSATATTAAQARFQDGGSIGVFTKQGAAAWTMRTIGGEPFPCGGVLPSDVTAAWNLATPAACSTTTGAAPAIATQAGTTGSVASIALSQVGRGDTPASTNWSLDCDAYTTLDGVGAGTSGCGVDPNFKVRDQNEFWCSDFAKWVWKQAGVTADLSVLNPGATSFATWAQDRGEHPKLDSGTPQVGDAIVFYPPNTTDPVGAYADHVGIIVGVNSANGTIEMANGDFMGPRNITVQNSGYVQIQPFANSWATGEKWLLVSPGLPTARSALATNAAGTDVAFVNTNGQVVHDWATSTGWKGPAAIGGTARADSPIVENAAGTIVAFIAPNGQVVNDWATSTGWKGPAANGGTARAGSALAMNAAGTDIVFANTSGAVVNDWGTSTGWKGPSGIGGTARSDSPIVEDNAGNLVMFIDAKGAVVNDWSTSTGWKGPSGIGGTARGGSPLATNDAGTDVVFVNTKGAVVNDWATSTGWKGPAGIGGTAASDSLIGQDGSGKDVAFLNGSNTVVHDWGTTTGWKGPAGIGGSARGKSPIVENDAGNRVMFIGTNGAVLNDWSTSTGWKGPSGIGGTAR